MIAIEIVRHQLSLAVRVDDHFTREPAHEGLVVALDTRELPVTAVDRTGPRNSDGTYRFIDLTPGARQVTVTGDRAFTWTPTTPVALPLADPTVPLVIELWPTASAAVPPGTLAIRGKLLAPAPALPIAPGQEVRIEAVGIFAPRNRKTRIDAANEFLFPVLGPMELTADRLVQLQLSLPTPARSIKAIALDDGGVLTNFPFAPPVAAATFKAPPSREIRVLITLS